MKDKVWRIRDAVHNLIEFDGLDPLESRLWRVVQTAAFQRLRRIRQLGFSEFVYPGATHTRFAHSLGVFHTARRLVSIIKKFEERSGERYEDQHAAPALAAALLHDVGHGMFSHAFEAVGEEFGWAMAKHEDVSQMLVKYGEIANILNDYSPHFADNVAEILKTHKNKELPANIFHAVVSSQFDADRLDYMQRDRLMTGVRSSSVDIEWLLTNLEVGNIKNSQEGDKELEPVQTLILGSKAQHTAENYVFSLFHLYPTIYYHKATCGFDIVFQALMRRLVSLVRADKAGDTGLGEEHPIIRFIEVEEKASKSGNKSENLDHVIALDDTVFLGSLSSLATARDNYIKKCAMAFKERQPLKAIDIKALVEAERQSEQKNISGNEAKAVGSICEDVVKRIKDEKGKDSEGTILCDKRKRPVYKTANEGERNAYLNQILIRIGDSPRDISEISAAIRKAEPFYAWRAYIFRDQREEDNLRYINTVIREVCNDR